MKCLSAVGIGFARPGSAWPGAGISDDFLNMNIANLPSVAPSYRNCRTASQQRRHHKFGRHRQKTAGTMVPAELAATARRLFGAGAPRLRDRVVLRAGPAAHPDRADDMAV